MRYYNLCSKKSYQKDGQEKVAWLPVGTLRENDKGQKFIELNILPNTPIYCFEPKPKAEPSGPEDFS